jgi:hypothetical protein
LSDLELEARRNPAALFAFGLASVGTESGVNGLVLSAADPRAEQIDRALAAFKFLVPIVSMLVVTRRP